MGHYIVRGAALLIVLTVFVLPLVATAQLPMPVRRIAVLQYGPQPSAAEPPPFVEEFRDALRERGWIEGRNLVIDWRQTKEGSDPFDTLVAELVQLPVEVLVVPNATTAGIARQVTTTIPIVVVGGGALLETGLVASLARPGGNVTGIATLGPERNAKQLELLKEAVPEVTRVAVLRGLAPQTLELQAMEGVAQSLGLQLQRVEARGAHEFDSAFAAMASAQAQALFVFGDPALTPYRQRIVDLAAQYHLPSICANRQYVEVGCLMSYGFSPRGRGQQIAAYVDKILKGAKPGDLPVERPMRFELIINLKTAEALGLTLSPLFLFRADEVLR